MKEIQVKYVAIYLRKSRDEGEYEDVLSKHRDTLVGMAKTKEWVYRLYEEVASGEKIESRPIMQTLLKDVLEEKYDAVLVMDIDRLGRGEHNDWAMIKNSFLVSETLIVTPNKTYNLQEDADDMTFDFQSIFAKFEYKMIKKRMKQGKIAGVKKGMWTNGKPPFPYYYDASTKTIKVDESKLPIYRFIIEKYLGGMYAQEIANWLNKNNVLMPNNQFPTKGNKDGWSAHTIMRLLVHEVHMGYVVYGKTIMKNGVKKPRDRSEWIIEKGTHEILKTQEEHDAIMKKSKESILIPYKVRTGALPLSGLLYCEICGRRMQFRRGVRRSGGEFWSAVCQYVDGHGNKCPQRSKLMDDDIYQMIYNRVVNVDEQVYKEFEDKQIYDSEVKQLMQIKKLELGKQQTALNRLYDAYEDGMYEKNAFVERKANRTKQISILEMEIEELESSINDRSIDSVVDLSSRINEFKEKWSTAQSATEINKALHLLVKKVFFDRKGDKLTLTICYK